MFSAKATELGDFGKMLIEAEPELKDGRLVTIMYKSVFYKKNNN